MKQGRVIIKYEAGETDEIVPFPGFGSNSDIQIINTGKEYLVRSTSYDDYDDMHGYSKPVFVYDYNLNHVDTIKINNKLVNAVDMSYIDGVYYITNDENITYRSVDLENWSVIGENLGSPMSNGASMVYKTRFNIRNIYTSGISNVYYKGIITSGNYLPEMHVIDEEIMLSGTRMYGEFYVGTYKDIYNEKDLIDPSNVKGMDGDILDIYRIGQAENRQYIAFSKDGVYWATLEIPYTSYSIGNIDMTNEGLIIKCIYDNISTRYVSIKFSDMEKVVPHSDVRVEVNNRVLGFSQPPVMEDDRTLVPMRFLFEQLGAEVSWDDTTQSATAAVASMNSARGGGGSQDWVGENNIVTFSIDNTTATVNGETKTMDVPARLIGDQTFVPLRFLSENLGYTVTWDDNTNTAKVITK